MIGFIVEHETAVVFDFDGTLLNSGLDKGVHIMYSCWVALYENGFGEVLHPSGVMSDVRRMYKVYKDQVGAPRMHQLMAITNALVSDGRGEIRDIGKLPISDRLKARYEQAEELYDGLFDQLNHAAAEPYWRLFPSTKSVLEGLSEDNDLFIVSGIGQTGLEDEVKRHGIDRWILKGIFGSSKKQDKGTVLSALRGLYGSILYVGDCPRDQSFARDCGVNFYRVRDDTDLNELLVALKGHEMPNMTEPWEYDEEERAFLVVKTARLIQVYVDGQKLTPIEMVDFIHDKPYMLRRLDVS